MQVMCDCGRTLNPEGRCDASHALSEDQYVAMLERQRQKQIRSKISIADKSNQMVEFDNQANFSTTNSNSVGIYINYSDNHLIENQLSTDCVIYQDNFDIFLKSKHSQYIAILTMFGGHNGWADQIEPLIALCDHVFIICTEVVPPVVDFIQQHDHHNVTYYLCGHLNFELKHSVVHQYMYWFDITTDFYRNWLPELLHRLHPFDTKESNFDILLGSQKSHRDFVFEQATKTSGSYVLTYFKNLLNWGVLQQPEWEQQGVKMHHIPGWTVETVEYYGYMLSLSQIIPFKIYNQTAYSVITESVAQNQFSFCTEKIVKPIIARRLFVIFAGKGYLANLKKLGFQTFDSIIDESYDNIDNDIERWQHAWNQIEWLNCQSQELILKKILLIVEHNFSIMMNTDWPGLFRQQLTQEFVNVIDFQEQN